MPFKCVGGSKSEQHWRDEFAAAGLPVVILGKRSTGKALGAMVKTRNANNPEVGPNSYNWVVDPFSFAQGNVLPVGNIPRTLQVHRGHNAALKVPFPRGILALTVA